MRPQQSDPAHTKIEEPCKTRGSRPAHSPNPGEKHHNKPLTNTQPKEGQRKEPNHTKLTSKAVVKRCQRNLYHLGKFCSVAAEDQAKKETQHPKTLVPRPQPQNHKKHPDAMTRKLEEQPYTRKKYRTGHRLSPAAHKIRSRDTSRKIIKQTRP